MAEYSKEKITAQLERALAVPLRAPLFTRCHSGESWGRDYFIHVEPRLMFCIAGEVSLATRRNNSSRLEKFALQPGEGLFGPAGNTLLECWDRPQQLFAAMFFRDFIRLIYIDHDGVSPPPQPTPNPTFYYHVPRPINAVGQGILVALANAAGQATAQSTPAGATELLRALLLNVREDLGACRDEESSARTRPSLLWHEVYSYVLENFTNPLLSRDAIAKHFHINVSHVSRLFQQNLGTSFVEYLASRRLEQAMTMLQDTSRPVKEIAELCGYQYTSYFIQAFRHRFQLSPGEFRKRLAGSENNPPEGISN